VIRDTLKRVPGSRTLRRWRAGRFGRLCGAIARPANNADFADTVDVEGWALSLDGQDVVVEVSVAGGPMVTVTPNVPSSYLSDMAGDVRGSDRAGFLARIPADALRIAPGDHVSVTVAIRAADGRGRVLGRRRLTYRPGLAAHSRGDYGAEWDAAAGSLEVARMSVCGSADASLHEASGIATSGELVRVCGITPDDVVLEIGCGTGRIGSKLAPQCREWIGCDVSRAMLEHTRTAMGAQTNYRLVHLNGRDLNAIASGSVDVVYCSGVFMHLDEWDRYRYVCEAFRVLRPGGRVYVDSMNLLGDEGWAQFLELSRLDPLQRPARIGKTSTPQEIEHYVARAGFTEVRLSSGPLWVTCWGRKPPAS
jgi:ubiquinone/menaquinone biosynthesis C-methylase UbiE